MTDTNELAAHFFRHNHAKLVAILVGYFGLKEVEIAEDIVQDTMVEAMEKWSVQSVPQNPEGWLIDVAKKKTINFLERNQNYKNRILPKLKSHTDLDFGHAQKRDSTLRMIFACCHPDLPTESQVALALKTLCGLNIREIAEALLTNEATINKRLYRAKQKFRDGSIAFIIPESHQLDERLDSVLTTLYLLFNEGYYSAHQEQIIRMDLCFEAIRLLEEVIDTYPDLNEAKALLALMYLSIARTESRIDENGALIIFSEQDRNSWDQGLIARGIDYLHQSSGSQRLSSYHLQAGIAAEHCLAPDFAATNWKSIYKQYELLEKLHSNAIVSFNKAIARFYAGEKQQALKDLLTLQEEPELRQYTHYFASIGTFYAELGEMNKAIPFFEKALSFSKTENERASIRKRLTQIT